MWAPDVACKNGKYFLYFPLKDQNDIFRIGVAVSNKPEDPFVPQPDPIKGSHSIDPAVLEDNDDNMFEFAEEPKNAMILDENGEPLKAGDHDRRYFEGPWMHKYNGKYDLSYSTGNTHQLCYAIGDSPYGPFSYTGVILTPVVGWTTHHSICEVKGKWYLFYHDSVPSGGKHGCVVLK